MSKTDAILWAVGDDAEHVHFDQDEALGAYAEERDDPPKPGEMVELHQYTPLKLPSSWDAIDTDFLCNLFDQLDETYGHSEAVDGSVPSPEVARAAAVLWDAVRATYDVWQCKPTRAFVKVDFHEWCMEEMPSMFEGHCIHCAEEMGKEPQACPGRDDPGGPCQTHPALEKGYGR